MAKNSKNTAALVRELVLPVVESMHLTLWDVRFVKEGAGMYLRIFIDKEGGVTIEDCERLSRAIDPLLDERELIDQSYCLEVSSPGLERELIRDEHFQQYIGADILVKLIRPMENIGRELDGTLKSYDGTSFEIADESGQTLRINKKDTVFVKLDDFDM